MPSKNSALASSPPRGRIGIVESSVRELGRNLKIAHRDAKAPRSRVDSKATPAYPLDRRDHDAVVCLLLELYDLHNYTCGVGSMHWYHGEHPEFKSEIRAKWGGEDQRPDASFSKMFARGRELFEARFPNEVKRLADYGLALTDVEYDDEDETPYPTNDDDRDREEGVYDRKALLCFFMELFESQNTTDPVTHWTEGEFEDLKESIDPSWAGDEGDPNDGFTRMTRRGLEIVEAAFPEESEKLRAFGMMYEPVVW